jgi:hypothetical protein
MSLPKAIQQPPGRSSTVAWYREKGCLLELAKLKSKKKS